MTAGASWGDLVPRLLSGAVLVLLGLAAIWEGGLWFQALILIAAAGMIWELARLCGAPGATAVPLGLAVGAALYLATRFGGFLPLALPLLVLVLATMALPRMRLAWILYGAVVVLAAFALIRFRAIGLPVVGWVVLVAVASDIAGYFAGRALGGPLFWPAISPKKTWSGTIAGWIAGLVVGALFWLAGGSIALLAISPVLALAAQLGDIAESAVKRRAGVKDSSSLIPGHGGLMDRFDGIAGASAALLLAGLLAGLPHAG